MIDDKKMDQLSMEELKDVKGGVPPYEKPVLIVMADGSTLCGNGISCVKGFSGGCSVGTICKTGRIDEPEE